jgi:hypothetical protein
MSSGLAKHALLLSFSVCLAMYSAPNVKAYDDIPNSENAIRDAYFLGSRQGSLNPEFLSRYSRWIPELKDGTCTSQVRLETPFLQVANYASQALNLSAQDAVKEFYGRRMIFRVYINVCYKPNAHLNAIKIKVFQNKRQVMALTSESKPYVPRVTEHTTLPANGEQIRLEFKSSQIDSSALVFRIETPDDQHAEVEFDMQTVR